MIGWSRLLGCLVLAGCSPAVIPGPLPPAGAPDDCKASSLQGLVGASEAQLAAMDFAVPVRIIHPGMPVTMDFSPSRLNIEVDAKGLISRVYCG